jgi:hypothetical protein
MRAGRKLSCERARRDRNRGDEARRRSGHGRSIPEGVVEVGASVREIASAAQSRSRIVNALAVDSVVFVRRIVARNVSRGQPPATLRRFISMS